MTKDKIDFKNEILNINGKKSFIYGGEVHYFRLPKTEWQDRIRKVKEAGCNLISTYIPWIWHEMEEGNIDLRGRTTPERDLKAFLQMIKDEGLYCLVRPGPYVMAEIRNEGLPHWIYEKHPEIIAKKQDGSNHQTRVVSYMHPKFLKEVERWYKSVCDVIRDFQFQSGGPVIMFQLDNEAGMLQWVTNQADYSDITLEYFINHLKDKYTIEELRNTLEVSLLDYGDIKEMIKKPEKDYAIAIQNEFMLFKREYYRIFLEELQGMAMKFGIDLPFVVNIHGFDSVDYGKRGLRYPIGISQLYETRKMKNTLLAGDYYIGNIVPDNYHDIVLANAFTKAIQNEEQPLFSAEFQGGFQNPKPILQPTTIDLNTRLCLANGMNAINYYMFAGGENYENIGLIGRRHDWQAPISTEGELRRQYYKIQDLGKTIRTIETEFLQSKKTVLTHLAFNPDYYMTEYWNEHTKKMYKEIQETRENFLFNGIGRGLTVNNITFEGYDIKKDERIDPDKIPTLWMFSTRWMDEEIQDKLINYVNDGGKLIIFPKLPVMDMKGKPCTKLMDALKVEIKEPVCWPHGVVEGVDSVQTFYMELYKGDGLTSFAYPEGRESECAAFEKEVGKGKIIVFGVGMEFLFPYTNEILLKLANRVGLNKITQNQDNIDVYFRCLEGTKTKFMFLQNYYDYEMTMPYDYLGEELFDGNSITVNPRSGLILPINYPLNNETELIYSTCELIDRNEKKIKIKCNQEIELIKFNTKVEILDNVEYEIHSVTSQEYQVVLKNCQNKIVSIKYNINEV